LRLPTVGQSLGACCQLSYRDRGLMATPLHVPAESDAGSYDKGGDGAPALQWIGERDRQERIIPIPSTIPRISECLPGSGCLDCS
jgi:hypothetical protein